MSNAERFIRDYKLISKLGEGGMGEVWLAEDTSLERQVAVKILAPELTRSPDIIARFRQEAKLQASLIHKNIVTLHTFFEEQGQYYMIMEYAQGITIKELIQQIGPIPESRVINILNQILDALAYAHEKGVIHRDIKPSNIMINPTNAEYVKIMDFGIAKLLGDQGITKTGTRMGTLYYMSPEQVRAEKDIDQRTDIYSLGITLFEMLTGTLPYNCNTESDYEILHQIVTQDISNSFLDTLHISQALKKAIKGMTEKVKNERYSSINEVLTLKPENAITNVAEASPQSQTSSTDTIIQSKTEYYHHSSETKTEINPLLNQNSPEPKENDIQTAAFIRRTTDSLAGVFLLVFIVNSCFLRGRTPFTSWIFWVWTPLIVLPSFIARQESWKVALIPVLWILASWFFVQQFLGFFFINLLRWW